MLSPPSMGTDVLEADASSRCLVMWLDTLFPAPISSRSNPAFLLRLDTQTPSSCSSSSSPATKTHPGPRCRLQVVERCLWGAVIAAERRHLILLDSPHGPAAAPKVSDGTRAFMGGGMFWSPPAEDGSGAGGGKERQRRPRCVHSELVNIEHGYTRGQDASRPQTEL